MQRNIDSEAAFIEIMPYFGKIDKGYMLGLQLNKKSNKIVTKGKEFLCKKAILNRSLTSLDIKSVDSLMDAKTTGEHVLELFKVGTIVLKNDKCYLEFLTLLENIVTEGFAQFSKILAVLHPSQYSKEAKIFNEHLNFKCKRLDDLIDPVYSNLFFKLEEYGLKQHLCSYGNISDCVERNIPYVQNLVIKLTSFKNEAVINELIQKVQNKIYHPLEEEKEEGKEIKFDFEKVMFLINKDTDMTQLFSEWIGLFQGKMVLFFASNKNKIKTDTKPDWSSKELDLILDGVEKCCENHSEIFFSAQHDYYTHIYSHNHVSSFDILSGKASGNTLIPHDLLQTIILKKGSKIYFENHEKEQVRSFRVEYGKINFLKIQNSNTSKDLNCIQIEPVFIHLKLVPNRFNFTTKMDVKNK